MNSLIKFHREPFIDALRAFYEELKVPVDYLADESTTAENILVDNQGKSLYNRNNEAHQLIAHLSAALSAWLKSQATDEEVKEVGTAKTKKG